MVKVTKNTHKVQVKTTKNLGPIAVILYQIAGKRNYLVANGVVFPNRNGRY